MRRYNDRYLPTRALALLGEHARRATMERSFVADSTSICTT